jgi:putative membrane protein
LNAAARLAACTALNGIHSVTKPPAKITMDATRPEGKGEHMTRKELRKWVGLFAVAVIATSAMIAAPHRVEANKSTRWPHLSDLDKEFLKDSNGGNLAELAWLPIVKSHASSSAAKDFASRMYRDHAKANAELLALAARKGVRLPHKVAEDEEAVQNRLKLESGSSFDKSYRNEMVRHHMRDIGMFEREISLGSDLGTKAYASKTLQVLREHLRLAQTMLSAASTNKSS